MRGREKPANYPLYSAVKRAVISYPQYFILRLVGKPETEYVKVLAEYGVLHGKNGYKVYLCRFFAREGLYRNKNDYFAAAQKKDFDSLKEGIEKKDFSAIARLAQQQRIFPIEKGLEFSVEEYDSSGGGAGAHAR